MFHTARSCAQAFRPTARGPEPLAGPVTHVPVLVEDGHHVGIHGVVSHSPVQCDGGQQLVSGQGAVLWSERERGKKKGWCTACVTPM